MQGMGNGETFGSRFAIGAPKETSLQNRSILGSIPRYIKSPPGGNGEMGKWGNGELSNRYLFFFILLTEYCLLNIDY